MTTQSGIRIQKVIAQAGLASRRGAERLIEEGHVRLNGEIVTVMGTTVLPGIDLLEVDGKKVSLGNPAREVWALYKPKNCVTTLSDPEGRPTVRDFFPRASGRIFPVGRLDYDAEGLLLLTNDGDLANRVAHPSFSVSKTYLVKIKGLLSEENLDHLKSGPMIDGKKRRPVKVRIIHTLTDKTWVEVSLKEGIHHHIKKMFKSEGFRVLKIKRFRIGPITLEDMEPGQFRKLGEKDIAKLLREKPEA